MTHGIGATTDPAVEVDVKTVPENETTATMTNANKVNATTTPSAQMADTSS